jgi:hypothetical protein
VKTITKQSSARQNSTSRISCTKKFWRTSLTVVFAVCQNGVASMRT